MALSSRDCGTQILLKATGVRMFLVVIEPVLFAGIHVAYLASGMTAYAAFGGAPVMVPLFTLLIGPVQATALTGICSAIALVHLVPWQLRDVR